VELAGGTGDDSDLRLMCAWKAAASARSEATTVCSVIQHAVREALNGFANPADLREAVEEAVAEHAGWHPPYMEAEAALAVGVVMRTEALGLPGDSGFRDELLKVGAAYRALASLRGVR